MCDTECTQAQAHCHKRVYVNEGARLLNVNRVAARTGSSCSYQASDCQRGREHEGKLSLQTLTARARYVTASLLTQRGNSLAAFCVREGAKPGFRLFALLTPCQELGSIGSVR